MIEYKIGNLFEEDVEAIVNTVNCVGVMGRGIALQFKKKYPGNFKAYAAACKRGEIEPGQLFAFETENATQSPHYIINFPTKRHWRDKSRIEDIDSGLQTLVNFIREKNIRSIAIPPLGCGLGGLDWNLVRLHITKTLENLTDVRVVVFEPQGAPATEKMVCNRKV